MKRVLYIEDEESLGGIVRDTLQLQGYSVIWIKDGAKAVEAFTNNSFDVAVIDIMLPNVDGYSIGRSIRGINPDIPIIFLTAKTETRDVVKGFESGGTDYMRKPFSMEELFVRIENQLNISGGRSKNIASADQISLGRFAFYPGLCELHYNDIVVSLSHRDTQILTLLAANRNNITDRRELLLSVWGDDSFFNSRNLDVYIRKIRNYLERDQSVELKTLKGKGYLFIVP